MKTLTKLLILLTLCVATSVSAAEVTSVTLSYENGSTVARIDVKGPFQFTHQTEVPKNGKPDRMILDVIGATDALAHSFSGLPACQIKQIRTSQYSVAPEKVVRIVFDLTKPPVYQVSSESNWIKVTFTDKTVAPFTSWTSGTAPAPTPTASSPKPMAAAPAPSTSTPVAPVTKTNQSIEKDRQSSLGVSPTTAPVKPAAVAAETKTSAEQKPAPTTVPVNKPAVTTASTPTTPSTQTPSNKPAVDQKPLATTTATPVTTQAPTNKPAVVATTQPSTTATASTPSTVKPAETAPSKTVAQTTETKPAGTTVTNKPAVEQKPVATTTTATATTQAPVNKPASAMTTTPANHPVAPTSPLTTSPEKTAVQQSTVSKPAMDQKPVVVANQTTTPTSTTTAPKVATEAKSSAAVNPATAQPTPKSETAVINKPAAPISALPSSVTNLQKPAQETKPTVATAKPSSVEATSKPTVTNSVTGTSPTVAKTESVKTPEPQVKSTTTEPAVANKPAATVATTSPETKPAVKSAPAVESTTAKPEPKAEVAKTDESKDSNAEAAHVKLPNAADNPTQLAEVEPSQPGTSTARFRRAPVESAKMKGALVAEFPQRLVVKYEDLGNRDPFATLIDDSRTNDRPNEQKIPNVEGLKLVGIIISPTGDNRALFADKAGYSYMMQSGDKVQRGYVLRVESDKVYFQIFEYGWSRTVALTIENED